MNKTIGIFGCGWLGLPLAQSFIADGEEVYGSTTSEDKLIDLEKLGIRPYLIALTENSINGAIDEFLSKITVLIINVPPKLRGGNSENYVQKIALLHKAIKKSNVKKIVFVSSTSVYGDTHGEVNEDTAPLPTTASGEQLLTCEQLFCNDSRLDATIVRFGGLIGNDRHPVNFLSGKKGLSNGSDPVNLIHQNDCINIITAILKNGWWNETFNGVYPHHPPKKDYYTAECIKRNLPVPVYEMTNSHSGKRINPHNLIIAKSFRFQTTIVS